MLGLYSSLRLNPIRSDCSLNKVFASVLLGLVGCTETHTFHAPDKELPPPGTTQLAAWKQEEYRRDPKKVARTITFRMTDKMRFDPSHITVKRGETVRFIARR